jgi:hypothetical protein
MSAPSAGLEYVSAEQCYSWPVLPRRLGWVGRWLTLCTDVTTTLWTMASFIDKRCTLNLANRMVCLYTRELVENHEATIFEGMIGLK